MMRSCQRGLRPTRRAALIAEAALVLPMALMMLFGIFEYCRFAFLLQMCENGVRHGARYAVVHTGDGTTTADVQNRVLSVLAGREKELAGYQITVESINPATGVAIPSSSWTDAPFGGAIRVRITGTYNPLVPSFIHAATAITVSAACTMNSEAN